MAGYTILRPLVRTNKAQLAGDSKDRFVPIERPTRSAILQPTKPEYETEADVTRAIAAGKRVQPNAYELAREWQKYQKSLQPKHFKAKPKGNPINKCRNFTLSFSR